MALGSTQPLTEMSTRYLLGGKGRLAPKADNLTAICEPIVYKMWEPRSLTTLWTSTACYTDGFTFFFLISCGNKYRPNVCFKGLTLYSLVESYKDCILPNDITIAN
jgi:hypothetical protein